jgi:hypothetical protein
MSSINPESEDGFYHMYLEDKSNPAAGLGFYKGLKEEISSKNHIYIGLLDSTIVDKLIETDIIEGLNNMLLDIGPRGGNTKAKEFSAVEILLPIRNVVNSCSLLAGV